MVVVDLITSTGCDVALEVEEPMFNNAFSLLDGSSSSTP